MQLQKGSVKDLKNLCGTDSLVNTFIDLTSYDTKANPDNQSSPSSIGQLRLGAHILCLVNNIGFKATQNEKGAIIIHVEASEGFEKCKKLALLAHLDTACEASGEDVKPHLVKNFQGDAIALDNGLIIDLDLCPELSEHKGDDIIVTDGTTLLGADDKAGVAVMLQMLYTLKTTELQHGPLCFVFSVDEEIGRSCDCITLDEIASDFAITIDGCNVGELDVATFNAKGAIFTIHGKSIHTAVAYKKLLNAITIASHIINDLPEKEAPETTKDLDGFYHVHDVEGSVQEAKIKLILRDFDKDKLLKREQFLITLKDKYNAIYEPNTVDLKIIDQYQNMADVLKEHGEILKLCKEAFKKAKVPVRENFVRGGTDGSHLSSKGLPCPNIFTGALNCHGPYECLPVRSLHKSFDVVKELIQVIATRG